MKLILSSVGCERSESVKSSNIMEEIMKENVGSERRDEVDMRLRELGARPKTCSTMDIRWKILDKYFCSGGFEENIICQEEDL